MVARHGQRHDARWRGLLAVRAERGWHVARILAGLESTARVPRLARHVSLHSVACARVAVPQLLPVQSKLRSTVFCLSHLAVVQSYFATVQSHVAWWWRSKCRGVQPHFSFVLSHLAKLQPNFT